MKKVAINGFGRIGRLAFRRMLHRSDLTVVAINDLTDVGTLAHLLKFDSIHGRFDGTVEVDGGNLKVNGNVVHITAERNPADLPWGQHGIDIVVESTGVFASKDGAAKHIEAGAKKVVISAPAKGDLKTIVLGVNDDILTADDSIVSNASCTTNCLAPMAMAIGAKQFVVQDALDTMLSSAVRISSLTPNTMVFKSPLAGAEITTFLAPASMCFAAPSFDAKTPVDSTTISMPCCPHGRSAGFRSAVICTTFPFTFRFPPSTSTVPSKRPWMESNFRRCASVPTSVRSLMATTVKSERCNIRRKAKRPMRPKPLIATFFILIGSKSIFTILVRWTKSVRCEPRPQDSQFCF